MKTVFKLNHLFVFLMALGSSFSFVACSSDDANIPIPPPEEASTKVMYGEYEGKMLTIMAAPMEEGGEGAPVGVDVLAKVDKDTVSFDAFPIRDIVVSIVGEEAADKIVEMVGDISYKIGYKSKFNEAKDSICFKFDPKPIMLAIEIPTPAEGTPLILNIEVKVAAEQIGNYELETSNLKFKFSATEVAFVNGEDRTEIEDFKPTTFDFDLKKIKVE